MVSFRMTPKYWDFAIEKRGRNRAPDYWSIQAICPAHTATPHDGHSDWPDRASSIWRSTSNWGSATGDNRRIEMLYERRSTKKYSRNRMNEPFSSEYIGFQYDSRSVHPWTWPWHSSKWCHNCSTSIPFLPLCYTDPEMRATELYTAWQSPSAVHGRADAFYPRMVATGLDHAMVRKFSQSSDYIGPSPTEAMDKKKRFNFLFS